MALFTFEVDTRGMRRRFSALIEAAQPDALAEPLLRSGGHLRARIKRDVFDVEGPGWKPLAESTLKRKMNEAEVSLLVDTGRGKANARSAVKRIVREADAAEKASAKIAQLKARLKERRALGRKTDAVERSLAARSARLDKAVSYIRDKRFVATAAGIGARHLVTYARNELARAKKHGEALRYLKRLKANIRKTGGDLSRADERRIGRIGQRRYKANTEETTKILGGLRNSLALRLRGLAIDIFSKAHIGAIHNFGGTAGHGAHIDARKYMDIMPSDIAFLVKACREASIDAWESAV